jgi:hypothetical protein
MAKLLVALGAREADITALRHVSEGLQGDPTLAFRRTRNGRFCIDLEHRQIFRMTPQPFVLTADEDFVRHDSGVVRVFDEIDDSLQSNTAMQALLIFKGMIVGGVPVAPRAFLDYASAKWVCTLFHIRTITVPELLGEPALEGVHSDGVDHTMTTFLGSQNMTSDSAVTYIHDPDEKNGTRWDAASPAMRFGQYQHTDFLDTLLIVDHERKHSLSPVFAQRGDETATRDMLIFFTRKPATEGHASHPYDDFASNDKSPMVIQIPTVEGNVSPWLEPSSSHL